MDSDPQVTPAKKPRRALRVVITVAIAAVVLLIVLVAAGIAYVYFWQATPATQQAAPASIKPVTSAPKPTQVIADDTPVGVSINTLTSPIAPGENSYISIKTLQTAACTITVEYNKVKSTDSGLVEKTADEYGVVSWSWTVPADAPYGTWPVTVTCAHGTKSAFVTGSLVVAKPDPSAQ